MKVVTLGVLLLVALPAFASPPGDIPGVFPLHRDRYDPPRKLSPLGASPETTYYGGTFWAADSMRWEALQDSLWTFDTGVGSDFEHHPASCKNPSFHHAMEGWTGEQSSQLPMGEFRRLHVSDFQNSYHTCVGTPLGLGGEYSLWAGLLELEAQTQCYDCGQGFGDGWNICMEQTLVVDGSGPVVWSWDYYVEMDTGGPSYTLALVDTVGDGSSSIEVLRMTGWGVSGSPQVTLTPGVNLRSDAGPVTLRYCVVGPYTYNDQGGEACSNCGPFAVDDISVLGGGINYTTDFETGTGGWTVGAFCEAITADQDFSRLMAVEDLPAIPDSIGPCDLTDSVLVFFDPQTGAHPDPSYQLLVSPWIDLTRAGKSPGQVQFIELSGFFDLFIYDMVFVQGYVQWAPVGCWEWPYGGPGMSPLVSDTFWYGGTGCIPVQLTGSGSNVGRIIFNDVVPESAESIRVGLSVQNWCSYFPSLCTGNVNSSPWIDRVRFGTVSMDVTAIPDPAPREHLQLRLANNPFRNRLSLTYAIPKGESAELRIYDIRGRLVFTRSLAAKEGSLVWNGRDAAARPVSNGVYFVQLHTASALKTRRVVRAR